MKMFKLKNNSPRLITLNNAKTVKGKKSVTSYQLLPAGPAVAVDETTIKLSYTQKLIDSGDIANLGAAAKDEAPANNENKDALLVEAKELGIEVDASWSGEQLQQEIEKAYNA